MGTEWTRLALVPACEPLVQWSSGLDQFPTRLQAEASLLTRAARRDTCRDAVFFESTFLLAARAIATTARASAVLAAAGSFAERAAWTVFTCVWTVLLMARFRNVRLIR
jgi:hypothetical protein